jgi:hypothetical protein
VLLNVEVGEWREVEVMGVGDVVRGLFAGALVWGPNAAAKVGQTRGPSTRASGLGDRLVSKQMKHNAAVLCAIKKWVGQGGKATLATAPDGDILGEIVGLLTQRVRAGRATFLIKVRSHRGEPINKRADTLAEEGREISDDNKRCDVRTDRMTFTVQKRNTTARSARTNSVRNAFRTQAGRNREMDKTQVYTMATAEKVASGGDWYISLWTADAKVWVQKNDGVHVASEGE